MVNKLGLHRVNRHNRLPSLSQSAAIFKILKLQLTLMYHLPGIRILNIPIFLKYLCLNVDFLDQKLEVEVILSKLTLDLGPPKQRWGTESPRCLSASISSTTI